MKYSIIIPSFNHCNDLLKPCCDSIIKYTDLNDAEVIISANGCKDNTKQYVESLGDKFKLIWSEDAIGYTKATNEGIKASTGEYIVLLNDDIVLLQQAPNTWINQHLQPFLEDNLVGGTGPFLMGYPRFIIFFCAMIKREMFNKFGLLDEVFSPGTCEDVDFCAKMQLGGYKIVQIPDNKTDWKKDISCLMGGCPIYHKGTKTFGAGGGDPAIIKRNKKIIRDRYGPIPIDFKEGKNFV